MLPITISYRELGLDVDEPEFQRELGRDWFERQDEGTQRRMMGPGLYDAWKAGTVKLEDMPKRVEDRTWGNSWQVSSLRELGIDGKAITAEDQHQA